MSDSVDFLHLNGSQNRERDINELQGLVRGVALDGRIVPEEVEAFRRWCSAKREWHDGSLFGEVRDRLREAMADGILDEEERADILFFCERLKTPSPFYSVATADMQRLHGLLAGIGADCVVNEEELRGLRDWMEAAENLKGTWPYDEVDSLITGVLADGRVDQEEHKFLVMFTQQFLEFSNSLILENALRRRACPIRRVRHATGGHLWREAVLRHGDVAQSIASRDRVGGCQSWRRGAPAGRAGTRLPSRGCRAHPLLGVLLLRAKGRAGNGVAQKRAATDHRPRDRLLGRGSGPRRQAAGSGQVRTLSSRRVRQLSAEVKPDLPLEGAE